MVNRWFKICKAVEDNVTDAMLTSANKIYTDDALLPGYKIAVEEGGNDFIVFSSSAIREATNRHVLRNSGKLI